MEGFKLLEQLSGPKTNVSMYLNISDVSSMYSSVWPDLVDRTSNSESKNGLHVEGQDVLPELEGPTRGSVNRLHVEAGDSEDSEILETGKEGLHRAIQIHRFTPF